ncbi:MAG: 2-oxo acid dehydrogenase subunit E2 [Deltaproteobacteria bacterium]|nr:2-oxo acid dehydrogenase subunit E2 [Deltaproteobacteria bacterium]MBW2629295.1 2-oxo acid dehydrogenase subunit E2 [Deltaproteobacteria bacterium]
MATKVTMPQLGESVVEGTIGKWLVSVGQSVAKDEPIVEILTDKADSELPAPVAGVVTQLFAAEDDIIAVGDPICEIDESAQAGATPAAASAQAPAAPDAASPSPTSPSVRKLAREKDVDLTGVQGSGDGGRIVRDDVMAAIGSSSSPQRMATPPPPPAIIPQVPAPRLAQPPARATGPGGAFRLPPYIPKDGDEIVPFTRRRRIIADHMVYSKQTAPDVVTFAECDLHRTAMLRDQHKGHFKKEGVNLTYLGFAIAATARALREFPEINSRVLDDAFVKLAEVNVGIAVDTDEGLVVPVIRNTDDLTIRGVARAVADVAERARSGNLTPNDLSGKTFTISNPGRRGNLVGGAIISQPNVAILRLGTIKKRVVVIEHEGEDVMAIHPVMHMALTYDHRVVDGVHANGFLYRIAEILEYGDFEL